MYLKSIEVNGFKSFANKLLFEFHNGITCIVGPNGSGKSNVGDAVRWVLGEQSAKQLRGASMQDVIFAGTQNRKPQSSAYVAITLDNSDHALAIDFDEVTVARRVYRSGESEYLINGSICRLRDVQELFYDTGIGKEGYSIIGQGQIDRILSTRPEDRRELFDEAAGIVKFKRRKLETVRKLDREHQDLARITDIVNELERRVGPLSRQSETARTYLKLREELKKMDVRLFSMEYGTHEKRLAETEDRLTIVKDELADTQTEEEKLKARYEELEDRLSGLESLIEGARTGSSEAEMEAKAAEGEIGVFREQIRAARDREGSIGGRLEELAASLAAHEKDIETVTAREEEAAGKREAALAEADARQAAYVEAQKRQEDNRRETEDKNAALMAAMNEAADTAAQAEGAKARLAADTARLEVIEGQLAASGSDEDRVKARLAEEEKKAAAAARQVTELDGVYRNLTERQDELAGETRRLSDEAFAAGQKYHAAHSRAESLRAIAERYEGYSGTVRAVMERRKDYPGIRGVVADLIHTEAKYETAVETALGGAMQNIVTDTQYTAKRIIGMLKAERLGRATFLPLDGIETDAGKLPPSALTAKGVIGPASRLVTADKDLAGLVDSLLGRIIVCENMDTALELAGKFRHSLRIVTLDGEFLRPGGSITGGAYKTKGNLLGRRREIEESEKTAASWKKRQEECEGGLKRAADESEYLRAQLEAVGEERKTREVERQTAAVTCEQIRAELARIGDGTRDLSGERDALKESIQSQQAEGKEREETIRTAQEAVERIRGELSALAEAEKTLREAAEAASAEVTAVQLSVTELTAGAGFIRQEKDRLAAEMQAIREEQERLSSGVSEIEAGIAEREEAIKDHEARIAALRQTAADSAEEQRVHQEEKDRLQKEQKQFFDRREELTGKSSLLDRELIRLESQRETHLSWLEDRAAYLYSEYEMTPSEAEAYAGDEDDGMGVTALRAGVAEHKRAIKALGPVNVNAIDEYKEVSERYEFMKTQYSDLVASEEELLKLIQELEKAMRERFNSQFSRINQEFDRVFKELFGGGTGTLELTEGDDVIEAGIRIIAQPPGKKLQNMMQLSGGEKALTAIALLFAIQNLKPSPFCLLDEIEAALDDSNVDRFAQYLHKLTEHTQFILISHRRGTMIAADRLYGITMQEKGVSAMVAVNLIEDQLDA